MKLKELLDVVHLGKQVSVNDNMGVHIDTVSISPVAEFTRAYECITPYLDSEVIMISTTPNNQLYVEIKDILK